MGKKSLTQHTSTWEKSIHILDIEEFRDSTPVGTHIQFEKAMDIAVSRKRPEIVSGIIKSKFPHIFMLEDGRTFSWKDYYLGRIK